MSIQFQSRDRRSNYKSYYRREEIKYNRSDWKTWENKEHAKVLTKKVYTPLKYKSITLLAMSVPMSVLSWSNDDIVFRLDWMCSSRNRSRLMRAT